MGRDLQVVSEARLPDTYEAARRALAECSEIDECKEWADKAAALASYARQADDGELYKMARRIQGRAVRRAGELLQTFQTGPKGGRPSKNGRGAPTVSQRAAAKAAGMSKDQEVTAVRIANLPEGDFEAAVESDDPPTVTALAGAGGPTPPGFTEATHLIGTVGRFAEFCAEHSPEDVATGVLPTEVGELTEELAAIKGWLERFITNLAGGA